MAPIKILRVELSEKLHSSGISGLAYSSLRDFLLLTLSTEDTASTYDDGPIGKSYLALVANARRRLASATDSVTLDACIDLAVADKRFEGHKIESLCIQRESRRRIALHMVADNDTGKSHLFKAVLRV
jgi:hypothetical protein